MTNAAITLHSVTKRYGQQQALNGIDLTVPAGSFFALLGPNGAGKTTLIRCLTGVLRPDSGTGEVLGEPLGLSYPSLALKARMGYVAQHPMLYPQMTARELVAFCRGLHRRWDDQLVHRYLDLFALPQTRTVRHLSPGMQAQLALTLVMGGRPELLILDEPTLGLDPLSRHQYLQVLLADSMELGCTVLLSSHDLHQIERLADRVAVLREGRVVLTGEVDDLKLAEKRVRVATADVSEAALLAVPGVRRAMRENSGWLLNARGDGQSLTERLLRVPGVTAVQVYDQSLEEIFLSYTS